MIAIRIQGVNIRYIDDGLFSQQPINEMAMGVEVKISIASIRVGTAVVFRSGSRSHWGRTCTYV
jgi:hypothetical protein